MGKVLGCLMHHSVLLTGALQTASDTPIELLPVQV